MIFFSWSKQESRRYAVLTKNLLEEVFGRTDLIWFSHGSVESGTGLFEFISDGIDKCDSVILFLTRENLYNPWLQFELGSFYSRRKERRIWPMFFGGERNKNTTPLEHIRLCEPEKKIFRSIVEFLYESNSPEKDLPPLDTLLERLSERWEGYIESLAEVRESILQDDDILSYVLRLGEECDMKATEGNVYRVDSGFETYRLYDYILRNTRSRLWVFGRKNKKLFDRTNLQHFRSFAEKDPSLFSFRCLFLDPSPKNTNLTNAQKKSHFETALRTCIDDAVDLLEEVGMTPSERIRFYRIVRNDAVIISDNTVFFENVRYDADMRPMHLTGTGFFLTSADTCIGRHFLDIFTDIWENNSFSFDETYG